MAYAILMTYMIIPQFYGKFLAHPCMAFTNLKSAYVTTRVIGVINMEEKCGLRKNVQISVQIGTNQCEHNTLILDALPVVIVLGLWQLLHLGTAMYGYILLAFKNPYSAQVTSKHQYVYNAVRMCSKQNNQDLKILVNGCSRRY